MPTKPAKQQVAPAEIPDWVDYDPIGCFLTMSNNPNGGELEDIELTHDEYLALKQHLAKLRGFAK